MNIHSTVLHGDVTTALKRGNRGDVTRIERNIWPVAWGWAYNHYHHEHAPSWSV